MTHRIEFPEEDPKLIARLVRYVYSLDADDMISPSNASQTKADIALYLHDHVGTYILGEKYDLPGLKQLSQAKFKSTCSKFTAPVLLPVFLSLVPLVYDNTSEKDRGMRDSLLAYILRFPRSTSNLPDFKAIAAANLDFVAELIGKTVSLKPPPPYKGSCTRCKATDKWKVDHVTCGCGWGERC